ncbi:MAG: Tex family protein [Bacillota bacterium]
MAEKELIKELVASLELDYGQVSNTVELLENGNTIPFIARYRKEATGGLDEVQLRELRDQFDYLTNLNEEKERVIKLIANQDKLTAELEDEIRAASTLQRVKDLYRPYRQKRKTRAAKARTKGLEPLAELFLNQELESGSVTDLASDYLSVENDLTEVAEVLEGARDIIAEIVADNPQVRKLARELTFNQGQITSEVKEDEDDTYAEYHDYQKQVSKLKPYQTLALDRGEAEDALQIKFTAPEEKIIRRIKELVITNRSSIFYQQLTAAIEDGYQRLVAPAIAREVRNHLTEEAQEHAIDIFADNLRTLLLQAPVRDKRVLAIDPGFRTGSKVAVVDEIGKLLTTSVIYPHPPQQQSKQSKATIKGLISKYEIDLIAIGNGTACRKTELFLAELIKELDSSLQYVIVNEAGASIYSASQVAQAEFPNLDAALRGTISIARRLQDPLAELVKIEPQHLGVGMYQHDLDQKKLATALETVVESVVNYVGVNLNTASASLLQYVAGINSSVADDIVKWREENGRFERRVELKDVYGIGPKTFTQAAGFLRIYGGEDQLAATTIHPESYPVAKELLATVNISLEELEVATTKDKLSERLDELDLQEYATSLDVGLPTLCDIKEALLRSDRDPRAKLPQPIFKEEVVSWDDLEEGMVMQGEVRNVVDFGAFVDIGVKEDGLIHISELSADYVDHPLDEVQVGDIVKVKILAVDSTRKRIALTLNF